MTMLHDRGYLVSQRELDMTMEQFREQFGDNPEYVRPAGMVGNARSERISCAIVAMWCGEYCLLQCSVACTRSKLLI